MIKKSRDREDAKVQLMRRFKLTERQTQAILEMRLHQLASLERLRVEQELKEKKDLIRELENILKSSKIVASHHSTKVEVGSTIVIQKEGVKDPKKLQIVGSEETDMSLGKISHKSPLGIALLDKKKGETISFQSPIGIIKYKIIDIE